MAVVRQIAELYAAWMESVAAGLASMLGRFAAPSSLRLVEQDNGRFAVEGAPQPAALVIAGGVATCPPETAATLDGSRVAVALRPDRFFFRQLEVPRRASEFLDGVVRAQIDRITPWTADEAVFGWSAPADAAPDRIAVTVVAAARAQIVPLTQAISELGAKSVTVSTTLPDGAAVKVFDRASARAGEASSLRRRLAAGLAAMLALAVFAAVADVVVGHRFQKSQAVVDRKIAERRGLIRAGTDAATNSALARLEVRKNETAASVIVLEAMSNVLPDNTYVTELRIEGDKVQLVGITQDAPSLIRLIERSPHFSRATFFAPTTRAPADPGDRFHIEAQIKPVFSPPS